MEQLMVISKAELSGITDELKNIRQELGRIQNGDQNKALSKKEVCELMGWSGTTYERMRRNVNNPLPVYSAGGPKCDYFDLMEWKNKQKELNINPQMS